MTWEWRGFDLKPQLCSNHLLRSEAGAAVSRLWPCLPSCPSLSLSLSQTQISLPFSFLPPPPLFPPLVVTPAGGLQLGLSDAELPGAEEASIEKKTNGWIKDHRLALTLFCFSMKKRCTWNEKWRCLETVHERKAATKCIYILFRELFKDPL